MNQPLASEMSAIGTRQDPDAEGEGEGNAGAGEKAAGDGDAATEGDVAADGDGAADADGVAAGLPMDPESWGTAPHAVSATQQTAASAAPFDCISFMSNGAVDSWYRAYARLCSSARPYALATSLYPEASTDATCALKAARL